MKSIIIIPARYASTRLPRKLLLAETGQPLIQHTYTAAQRAKLPSGVVVACDHDEIEAAVRAFGGNVVRTDPNAPSGTDRIAEVVRTQPEIKDIDISDVDIIVNVQGDEPTIAGEAIDQVVRLLEGDPSAVMATLATPIRSRERLDDPSCVKVVFAPTASDRRSGTAIYFSRSLIPYPRTWDDASLHREPPLFFQHIGLYAYRRDFLLTLTRLPVSPLEDAEKLEQLRALENGYRISLGVTDHAGIGIDTPEDYRCFVAAWKTKNVTA